MQSAQSLPIQADQTSQPRTSHPEDAIFIQHFKVFMDGLKSITTDVNFGEITAVLDLNTSLRKQLAETEKKLQDKDVAIREMFAANEREKSKQTDTQNRMQTLEASIQEKTAALEEKRKEIESLKKAVKNLETSVKGKDEIIVSANKGITALNIDLKTKNEEINKMKDAGKRLKAARENLMDQVKKLELQNSKLDQEKETYLTSLNEIKSFGAGFYEGEHESVYVMPRDN